MGAGRPPVFWMNGLPPMPRKSQKVQSITTKIVGIVQSSRRTMKPITATLAGRPPCATYAAPSRLVPGPRRNGPRNVLVDS